MEYTDDEHKILSIMKRTEIVYVGLGLLENVYFYFRRK